MKKILIILTLLIIAALGGYFYLYKDHRDIASENAMAINGLSVVKEFETNENSANKKYLDQTIQVSGKITNVDSKAKTAVLDEKIFLSFSNQEAINIGQTISVKGRLVGYDSLLGEINIDQCTLLTL